MKALVLFCVHEYGPIHRDELEGRIDALSEAEREEALNRFLPTV